MKILSVLLLIAIFFTSAGDCRAEDNDWLKLLQDAKKAQKPVHVEWKVSRIIAANPELAARIAAEYDKRAKKAEEDKEETKALSFKSLSTHMRDELSNERRITFLLDAYYINARRFRIEQTFDPDAEPLKMTYICNGDTVYVVHDRQSTVELKPNPDKFLEELLRGYSSFSLPGMYLEELKLATATTKTDGSTLHVTAQSNHYVGYQLTFDTEVSQLVEAHIQQGKSTKLIITTPLEDGQSVLHFDQFNNGKPHIQEEWHLLSEKPIVDPAKLDVDFNPPRGYSVIDRRKENSDVNKE